MWETTQFFELTFRNSGGTMSCSGDNTPQLLSHSLASSLKVVCDPDVIVFLILCFDKYVPFVDLNFCSLDRINCPFNVVLIC